MKKIGALLLILMLLVSCQTNQTTERNLKILAPTGAPAVTLIPSLIGEQDEIELVNGPDNLQAALISENQNYDIVIAPLNLGIALQNQGKTNYKLHSIVTWGNLYVVVSNSEVNSLVAFAEASVPGLVFKSLIEYFPFSAEIIWVNSVNEAQALLLSNKVDAALLAQPLVAATIAKGKQEGIELEILSNLQILYSHKNNVKNYPQAALFIAENADEKEIDELVKSLSEYVDNISQNKEKFLTDVETITAEKLGIPSGEIVFNVFDSMGIEIVKASSTIDEIDAFLELFNLQLDENYVIK